jgi:carbon-monoxide dehydrogenase medium subunit
MKAAAFDYARPRSLAEAIGLLAAANGDAQLMAGGQSLVAMMNLRVAAPALVVDIGRLDELRTVAEEGDEVRLGACTTHAAIEDGRVPDPSRGLLPRVASTLAYRAIRVRGTIGGSLALSDPAAEWPTVLTALDARAVLRGPGGERSVPVAGFITGIYETTLGSDEIIESVGIPKLSAAARWGYVKFCRKSGEFANAIAAVVRDPERGYARAVLGAANGAPIVLARTGEWMGSGRTDEDGLRVAIDADLDAARERHFDEYQRSLHATTALRAARQVLT